MKLREGRRRRGRNTNEGEADRAGGNRNHSGRGGKADKEVEHEKGMGRDGVQSEAWMYGTERMVERTDERSMEKRGIPGRLERKRNMPHL
jgi:hypothetical protein